MIFYAGSKLEKVSRIGNNVTLFKDSVIWNVSADPGTTFCYVSLTYDEWWSQYKRYMTQPGIRITRCVKDFYWGIKYRIPLCCVIQFCVDTLLGESQQGVRRGDKPNNKAGGVYVPCSRCGGTI